MPAPTPQSRPSNASLVPQKIEWATNRTPCRTNNSIHITNTTKTTNYVGVYAASSNPRSDPRPYLQLLHPLHPWASLVPPTKGRPDERDHKQFIPMTPRSENNSTMGVGIPAASRDTILKRTITKWCMTMGTLRT